MATNGTDVLAERQKPKKEKPQKAAAQANHTKKQDASAGKKSDGPALIGITAAKEDDLADWYSQVLIKGNMIDYYDVSGCYIYLPNSMYMWRTIRNWFTERIESIGVDDCYFPLFISEDSLTKEKEHVEGFAAEVAWVTHGGKSKLDKPVAIRPTSETAMYGFYSKRIQSHRDLPLKMNQWNNVIRWEFKHPMPFLRSREFLWQEGHTAHLTEEEAGKEVLQILDWYAGIYEELLAVPVVKGRKTVNEQFPGAHYTTTIEGFIPGTGRGIQAGTSHCLGQNFAKMYNIMVEDPSTKEGEEKRRIHVWQNSWGLTTRSIGVMVLVHGDNKGMVIPPRVAKVQVVIIPVGITAKTSAEDKEKLFSEVRAMEQTLRTAGVRVAIELRDDKNTGWKFSEYEQKGVPLRLEVGFKDLAAQQVTTARRDHAIAGTKGTIAIANLAKEVPAILDTIQADLFNKADAEYRAHRKVVHEWADFVPTLNAKNVCLIRHCLGAKCEDEIKEMSARKDEGDSAAEDARAPAMGAKSLCIPFEQPEGGIVEGETKCTNPNCGELAQKWVMFGRSY